MVVKGLSFAEYGVFYALKVPISGSIYPSSKLVMRRQKMTI